MPSTRAVRVAAGLALTVAGGVSALFLTIGPINSTSADAGSQTDTNASNETVGLDPASGDPTTIVEYVDQFGNPIDPDRISSGTTNSVAPSDLGVAPAGSYDDDHYEDDDHGGHEDHEYGGHEYEDDDD